MSSAHPDSSLSPERADASPEVTKAPEAVAPETGARAAPSSERSAPVAESAEKGVWALLVSVGLALLAAAALALAASAWLRLNGLQEDWGRKVADVGQQQRLDAQAIQDLQSQARELQALSRAQEARVAELSAQRLQLENVVKQLTQTQDQSLAQDIESSIRMSIMQSEMVGHVRPMVAALQSALDRVARSDQIRTGALQVALQEDLKTIQQAHVADVPLVLKKLSDVVQAVAVMPFGVAPPSLAQAPTESAQPRWEWAKLWDVSEWRHVGSAIQEALVGVLRIQQAPQTSALTLKPDQAQFLSQQLQLRLLAVRISVLNGRVELARQELDLVISGINQFAQLEQATVQQTLGELSAVKEALDQMVLPKPERSLRALASVAK